MSWLIRFRWEGSEVQDSQTKIIDQRKPPNRLTLAKLATNVARIICKFIEARAKYPNGEGGG